MKREWSGCERRRRTPRPPSHSPPPGAAHAGGGLSCCAAPFHHPARPRPSHADALPAQIPRQAPDLAVASGRHRSNPVPAGDHRSGEAPVRALQVRKRPVVGATMARTSLRNVRKMPQRAGPTKGRFPMGLRRQGRRVCLRPGQARRPAPPGPGVDCRVQAASARRSSGVKRASTALRTSGPALCSMALQSAVLWMVATMPRSIS